MNRAECGESRGRLPTLEAEPPGAGGAARNGVSTSGGRRDAEKMP